MKKFIAILTAAAMILTLSSCGSESAETTTTPAETTPAETTAPAQTDAPESDETDAPAETEAPESDEIDAPEPEETDASESADPNDPMAILKANVPIYADYIESQMTLPFRVGFAYEQDLYGTGVASRIEMETIVKSPEEMAVITLMDGAEERIVITGDRYYMISAAEKTAIYMDIDDEMRAQLTETMTAGLSQGVLFDAASATYETGTEEYNGKKYLFEKINASEMEATVYADPATKEIKYLISEGVALEVTAATHDVDDSIFVIPSDYTVVSMADAMGGAPDVQ